jgi:hypothetical protein
VYASVFGLVYAYTSEVGLAYSGTDVHSPPTIVPCYKTNIRQQHSPRRILSLVEAETPDDDCALSVLKRKTFHPSDDEETLFKRMRESM